MLHGMHLPTFSMRALTIAFRVMVLCHQTLKVTSSYPVAQQLTPCHVCYYSLRGCVPQPNFWETGRHSKCKSFNINIL